MARLARVVISSRERPILLEPVQNGIRGVTLRFAHEVRASEDYFASIPEIVLPPEMLKLAEHIIETKADDFDPSMLEDHYRTALVEILRKKQGQLPLHVAPGEAVRRECRARHLSGVNLIDFLPRRPVRPRCVIFGAACAALGVLRDPGRG